MELSESKKYELKLKALNEACLQHGICYSKLYTMHQYFSYKEDGESSAKYNISEKGFEAPIVFFASMIFKRIKSSKAFLKEALNHLNKELSGEWLKQVMFTYLKKYRLYIDILKGNVFIYQNPDFEITPPPYNFDWVGFEKVAGDTTLWDLVSTGRKGLSEVLMSFEKIILNRIDYENSKNNNNDDVATND